ncbi:MAG: PQQ-dependent sugar dehydrogenase [Pseudomonadota bacterium]
MTRNTTNTAMRVQIGLGALAALTVLAGCGKGDSRVAAQNQAKAPPAPTCAANDSGLSLAPGFCATVFADNVGHARHMTVSPQGVVYVNTWSGQYYGNDKPPEGGFLVALQDTDGDGKADKTDRFGAGVPEKATGGTGIALYGGALYAEQNDGILKFALTEGTAVPTGKAEKVLSGFPMSGDHFMHPFVIDKEGNLYVNSGSASNACELKARQPGSKGQEPCNELNTRAGIWKYDANKTGQKFSPAERYATGIRNSGGQSFDAAGKLFAVQHGRDQLPENYPAFYTPTVGRELPAEVMVNVESGGDYGWPYCYMDGQQRRMMRAPEYGGDGKASGDCVNKRTPVAVFPAHWAPNDVLVYTGTAFPKEYQGGAFVAFHGSWNRAPGPQGGYNVVFQPMIDGAASDPYVVFADGFAGAEKAPGRAEHRPSGLAMGPDGALYISDDVKGRIWRVTHLGAGAPTAVAAAPTPAPVAAASGTGPIPLADLKPPPGGSAELVAQGEKVFRGQVSGGTCTGCHGSDGRGTQVGSNLTNGTYLHSKGDLAGIKQTIVKGVATAKQAIGAMPPLGAAPLTDADVDAVANYVWAIGHK